MLISGRYHTLRVNRASDFGLYLADEEGGEVLLPNRYVQPEYREGDPLDVFVYHDSEDRLVATTERPFATVGEAAFLRVADVNAHGAFLDWGIRAKDLFLPHRNQQGRVEPGQNTLVFLYTDNVTGRVVATNYLNGFITNIDIDLRPKQEVDILLAGEIPTGFRAVVDNRHWGLLYRNELFRDLAVGDRMKAYVRRITDDRRVDLSLQRQGYDEVKHAASVLTELMRGNGGSIPLNDDSDPETVRRMIRMSKKVFKRAMGYLMKQGEVEMTTEGTRLKRRQR